MEIQMYGMKSELGSCFENVEMDSVGVVSRCG